MTDGNSPGLQ